MSEPSLALQKAIRDRLVATLEIVALVPADNIFDRSARPERFPCIVLGDGYSDFAHLYETFHDRAFADLHIWSEENSLTGVKTIAGLVRKALTTSPLTVDGFDCRDLAVVSGRYLRDPDGLHAHAVVSLEAIMMETA